MEELRTLMVQQALKLTDRRNARSQIEEERRHKTAQAQRTAIFSCRPAGRAGPATGTPESGELPPEFPAGTAEEFRRLPGRGPGDPAEARGPETDDERHLGAGGGHRRNRPQIRMRGGVGPGRAVAALHRPGPRGKSEGDRIPEDERIGAIQLYPFQLKQNPALSPTVPRGDGGVPLVDVIKVKEEFAQLAPAFCSEMS